MRASTPARIPQCPTGRRRRHRATPHRETSVHELLAAHGVHGPFTLYAGTIESRKNLERLIEAHRVASSKIPDLGTLVLVGPRGWGDVSTGSATVLGLVAREMLLGLYRDATVFAYVPLAEGWGLPPVEALQYRHAGRGQFHDAERRRQRTRRTESIHWTSRPLPRGSLARARSRRRRRELAWRGVSRWPISRGCNVALDHLAAWR